MDIAEWLKGLGLGRYTSAFAENAVRWDVLPRLTADDLREIGVTAVGDRRRLLDAIAALASGDVPTAPSKTAPPVAAAEAERRQLTVMFCDLVGSTALTTRFDPEDLREIFAVYHRSVADTSSRFAGFVAKYMGDGVLVYFGYPQAHEDDPERAVRAGLAVIDAIAALDLPQPLAVRIGIASGLVVVGDLIGEGEAQERNVVGETPNLAARLQAIAAPNRIVIADSTRRQLGGLFDIEDLGPQALAGFADAPRAWRVIGESGVISRFEALRSQATPLVGRDEELDLLLRRWQQAKAGEGRVVLVSGEPGIGKSRLTTAVVESIAKEPHTRLRYFCSPHHQDTALYPFIVQLERAGGFARDDTPEQKLHKLKALLAAGIRDEQLTLIAELLSLPNAGAELNLSPQRKRERLFESLLGQLQAIARGTPVLLIFEDAQWIDPTSRELLDLSIDRVRDLPVLLVVTFRPEFQPSWGGQPHVTILALNRLGGRHGTALVQNLAGNAALEPDIVAEIVERTDGVPLFVEELTKAVLESANAGNRVEAVLAASPAATLTIPATLQASLIARLDRLGTAAKEVAQVSAVLGREFSYELIGRVAGRADLDAALGKLTDAGLLFCRGVPPHSSYLFKHALVQDAAYGTLLRSRRQELHARVAAVLEADFADLALDRPEVLAHHHTQARSIDRAVSYLTKAGLKALERSAMSEAASQLAKGLDLIADLPAEADRSAQELALLTALGRALTASKGYAAPETGQAYARARRLCEDLGDVTTLVRVGYGQYLYHLIRAEIGECHGVAEEILAFAEKTRSDEARILGRRTLGVSLFESGQLQAARVQLEFASGLLEEQRQRGAANRSDAGVTVPAWLAFVAAFQGYADQAARIRDLSVREANTTTSLHSRVFGLAFAAGTCCVLRQYDDMLSRADTICALATELNFPFMLAWGMAFRGIAELHAGTGRGQAAWDGLALYQQTNSKWALPFWFGCYVSVQRHPSDETISMIQQGLDAIEATGERWFEAELYRLRGNFARSFPREDDRHAEQDFETAMRIAALQGAKLLELRATTSLARLWSEHGRRSEARELLAPLYGWFTEGFDTADLKEARTLLTALA